MSIQDEIIEEKSEFKDELEKVVGKGEIDNFTKFAFKGRMGEMAVAFILGAYFQKAVEAISSCLIMPIIQFALISTTGNWRTLVWTPVIGLTFEIGKFIGVFFDFFLTALILYILYQKILTKIFVVQNAALKVCPYCMSKIDQRATSCNFCTSYLEN